MRVNWIRFTVKMNCAATALLISRQYTLNSHLANIYIITFVREGLMYVYLFYCFSIDFITPLSNFTLLVLGFPLNDIVADLQEN